MIPIGLALALPSPETGNAIDDLVARAQHAADAGLASLWLGQMYDIDALTAVALIGRDVPGITLGTAVTTIHSRHPITMSSHAKTAQAATRGRLALGLGTGHRATVEQRYGHRFDRPTHRMREYLIALRALLRDEKVSFHGETVTADTVGWPTQVAGSTPPPPVLIAALGPAMLRVAGELADGTITWLAGPRTIAEHVSPAITAASGSRPAPQVVASLPVCLTREPDVARDRAAASLAFYASVPSYRAILDREGAQSPADVAVIGDEARIERAIARLADAGATHFAANPAMFTTAEEHARTIDFLGSLTTR
jgi:F420-dependent oxidoreductase-like protein